MSGAVNDQSLAALCFARRHGLSASLSTAYAHHRRRREFDAFRIGFVHHEDDLQADSLMEDVPWYLPASRRYEPDRLAGIHIVALLEHCEQRGMKAFDSVFLCGRHKECPSLRPTRPHSGPQARQTSAHCAGGGMTASLSDKGGWLVVPPL